MWSLIFFQKKSNYSVNKIEQEPDAYKNEPLIRDDSHSDLSVVSSNNDDIANHKINAELYNYKLNVKTRIHDIKTPLNNIVLSINADENISKENKLNVIENAYIIKELLNDLLKNTDNLTDFKFTKQKININKLSTKIQHLLKNEIDKHKKPLLVNVTNLYSEYFHGDEKLIIRLLTNLIKNSLKYKNEMFTPIKITVENSLNEKTLVTKFIVSDYNDDIPIEIKSKMFTAFNSTNDSGLGLYICKKIMDLHNGTINYHRVKSTNNFIMIFKNQLLSGSFEESDTSSEGSDKIKKHIENLVNESQFDMLNKKTMLLVDDCVVTLKLLKFNIKKEDTQNIYEVNTINNLDKKFFEPENIEKLKKYDVIVTDYQIANTTCLKLIDYLREINYSGKIYCITGYEDDEIVSNLLERNINGIFFKPINNDIIKNIVKS